MIGRLRLFLFLAFKLSLRSRHYRFLKFDSRAEPVGGLEHEPHHPDLDHRLPAVLRHRVQDQAGGSRHRTRG